jgi:hypothetical protein
MANTFYQYLAYCEPNSNADLATLRTNLEKFYAGPTIKIKPVITLTGNKITVSYSEYNFFIFLSDEEHVLEEAIELADTDDTGLDWADQPFDKDKLKTCAKRFEMWGEEDYDMDYFNDSLFIIQTIEQFSGMIIFFMN